MSSIVKNIVNSYVFYAGWTSGWAGVRDQTSSNEISTTDRLIGECSRDNPGSNYKITRATATFDTSAIPANATVSSATLNWFRWYETAEQNSDPSLYVCPVSETGNNKAYYNKAYFGTSIGNIPNSYSYPNNGFPNATVNIALTVSGIVKNGTTILGFRIGHDYNGAVDSPGNIDKWNRISTTNGSTTLTVVYTTPPAVTTGASSTITDTTATLAGTVTDYGGGTVSARGVCWATGANPTTANAKATTGSDAISVSATGLTKNTLYHYRAFVTTENSTQYGSDTTFTTDNDPAVTSGAVTLLQPISATVGGNITSNGNATVTAAGVCWATTINPTTSSPKTATATVLGAYTVSTGQVLIPGILYHYRAYVTTAVSTQYGTDTTFRTPSGANLLLNFM